ncbi:protein-L-isoaspartate O-methyltransferase [Chitinimonas sp.]|uniref:protein-L-isoaspartate O-methyltransferase family protein n=1 Tax=Chitinimonas sp. TaxID=1934313 RepID=UPI0035B07CD2
MDWDKARYLMVEQQIRPWDVLDQTVLQLLLEIKREDFVPAAYRDMALVDIELPLGNGRKAWQPRVEARAAQELKLTGKEHVLLIGASTGFLAALLARLAKHVQVVEPDAAQAEHAKAALHAAGIHNVTVEVGDAVNGWAAHAPYDAIIASGSYPLKPQVLFEQLNDGGRVFAVVGEEPAMSATRYTKVGSSIKEEKLFETVIAPFVNAPQPARFQF